MVAHCFFEQSGTFRDEFRKLGVESYDYDIANDYGKTDYQIDLFEEIEKAYGGVPRCSIKLIVMMLSWHFSLASGLKQKSLCQ